MSRRFLLRMSRLGLVCQFCKGSEMNFDTATTEEMNAFMDNLSRVSAIIIDERRRIDAVELICEQIELDRGVQSIDDRDT